jgi:hypothetical protein
MDKNNNNDQKKFDVAVFHDMSKKITMKEIENFLDESKIIKLNKQTEQVKYQNIEFDSLDDKTRKNFFFNLILENVKIYFEGDAIAYTEFEIIKGQSFPKHEKQ